MQVSVLSASHLHRASWGPSNRSTKPSLASSRRRPDRPNTSLGRDARKRGFARVPKTPGAPPFPVIILGRGAIREGWSGCHQDGGGFSGPSAAPSPSQSPYWLPRSRVHFYRRTRHNLVLIGRFSWASQRDWCASPIVSSCLYICIKILVVVFVFYLVFFLIC